MQPTPEHWLPIPGYEGHYEVSDHGRVRSLARMVEQPEKRSYLRRERILKQTAGRRGYMRVTLFREGVGMARPVHQLVLEAFVGPCPEGMEACHWNDVPDNNHVSNLRWDTPSANMRDKVRNGGHHLKNMTHCMQGHEFTEANTYVGANGKRQCRPCAAAGARARRARRAANKAQAIDALLDRRNNLTHP